MPLAGSPAIEESLVVGPDRVASCPARSHPRARACSRTTRPRPAPANDLPAPRCRDVPPVGASRPRGRSSDRCSGAARRWIGRGYPRNPADDASSTRRLIVSTGGVSSSTQIQNRSISVSARGGGPCASMSAHVVEADRGLARADHREDVHVRHVVVPRTEDIARISAHTDVGDIVGPTGVRRRVCGS